MGETLDALAVQLTDNNSGMLVVVQSLRPDHFFNVFEQQRLAELMQQWRTALSLGTSLPTGEQAELDALTEKELAASGERAAFLAEAARR